MHKTNKVLIFGIGGLIGEAVAGELGMGIERMGTYHKRPVDKGLLCDITQKESIEKVFEQVRPSHVVHAVNFPGSVKACEENPKEARRYHYDATVDIGNLCTHYKAKLTFISTECVFDGKKEIYTEETPPSPINIYGKYKAESEEWIRKNLKQYIIVRTMSVFGWQPKTQTPNALMSMYFSLKDNKSFSVPTYRYVSPTYVGDLAKAIIELSVSDHCGLFNVVGASFMSRYEWLLKTAKTLGWRSDLILPQQAPHPGEVPYPSKVYLNTAKFRKIASTQLHTMDEALKLLKKDIDTQSVLI